MSGFEIKVDRIDLTLEKVEAATAKGLEACGLVAEGYAKDKAPFDTGRLLNSISHAVDDDTVYIGTNVEYAPYQEMGTYKMKAQPFLRPALENNVSAYQKLLEQVFKDI